MGSKRIKVLYLAVIGLSALFAYRLYFLQVIQVESLRAKADRQYQETTGTLERGTIYFRSKNGELVPAATMESGFLLAIEPRRLTNPEAAFEKLSQILELDRESFLVKASRRENPYEEKIARRLDRQTAEKIERLNLPGVKVFKDRWRAYPFARLASQTIGLLGYQGHELAGRYGLERYYDHLLRRQPEKSFINFLAETLKEVGSTAFGRETVARAEADLVLTIEPTVQNSLTTELNQAKERWRAEAAGGLILDPRTGEITALTALPDFDPGARQADLNLLQNPLVVHVFEMGSVIKPLTLAAGLDAGVISGETTYLDQGYIILNNKRLQNYDGKGRGRVKMQEVLNQSLNTGAVFVMQQLGPDRFRDYFLAFGLGEKTGIDLPNETKGLVGNLKSPQEVDYATAAFGQGIALTPLAASRALAALANGGLLIRPHLVKQFNWETKLWTEVKPEIQRRVLRPETSQEITRMLVSAVDTALAHRRVKLKNYQIAAKTGTAQMVAPTGGYEPDRFFHSFFGYFPASEPRFLVFLYLTAPQGARFASETLSDPFSRISRFLINYYHLPPDR